MQTRDMQYWQKRWDDFVVVATNVTSRADLLDEMKKAGGDVSQFNPDDVVAIQYKKALGLLIEYSGAMKLSDNTDAYGFAGIGRFFSGHWGTTFGSQVAAVVDIHSSGASNTYNIFEKERKVENLLGDLKAALVGEVIKPDGDLSRVIAVICNNCQINYADINTEQHGLAAVGAKWSDQFGAGEKKLGM